MSGNAAGRARVSVVIPCRDHADELAVCLDSLDRQDPAVPCEIVVVDAAGSEAVARVVSAHPDVKLVRSATPLHAAAARNLGAGASAAPKLAFLDADCAAEPDWLAALDRALDGSAAAVGGPVLDLLPFHPIAAADNLLQFYDRPAARRDTEIDYFPSCNLALSRDRFEALGGFPDVPAFEDIYFTRAAAAAPGGLRFVPGMRVRHRGRTRFGDFLRHHHHFGRSRGRAGIPGRALERRFGHLALWAPWAVLRRLAYMAWRTAHHRPLDLLRFSLLAPLLLLGVGAWSVGLVQGSRERRRDARMQAFDPQEVEP